MENYGKRIHFFANIIDNERTEYYTFIKKKIDILIDALWKNE